MKAESGLLGPFIKQRIACTRELLERLVLKYIPGSEEGSHLVGVRRWRRVLTSRAYSCTIASAASSFEADK